MLFKNFLKWYGVESYFGIFFYNSTWSMILCNRPRDFFKKIILVCKLYAVLLPNLLRPNVHFIVSGENDIWSTNLTLIFDTLILILCRYIENEILKKFQLVSAYFLMQFRSAKNLRCFNVLFRRDIDGRKIFLVSTYFVWHNFYGQKIYIVSP